ncbi:GspH/FimT family protein [Stenotrophomonas oahuensis]|uniref:Type II secretion system protein H n=1 Tax=Stenotrophomonas oahuensis TaxID=3003271 RepID=A0ABY9YMU0_9GAMM|nr:GspH/FimT family protein [Stenotrophomonas sp. A5586]WNH51554.1 GspH/FimT family protein [Stenotrophomonas sp. A5586]
MPRPYPLVQPPRRVFRGWTLLELTCALALAALLCALAVPAFGGLVTRLRADMVRMQMATAFNMARNTAITRHRPIAVCASEDGWRCGGDWSRGWLIYRDHGPSPVPIAEEDILRFQPGSTAKSVRAGASLGRHRLRFQRDGRSSGSNLTVSICAGPTLHSQVIVNNVGRTRARRVPQPTPCPF